MSFILSVPAKVSYLQRALASPQEDQLFISPNQVQGRRLMNWNCFIKG